MDGKLTISRYNDFGNKDPIHITITDEKSGVSFCDIEMSLENFARAITGISLQKCNFSTHNLSKVGMKREIKSESVQTPDDFSSSNKDEKIKILKPYNIDGWQGSLSDLGNHHHYNYGNKSYTVSFTRWVEDNTE